MDRIITFLLLCCNISFLCGQGRTLTSQYLYNKLSINPAYAGTNNSLDFTLLHRSQWQGIKGAPTQQILSVNFPKIKDALGIGLNINHLTYGITQFVEFSLPYSYSLSLGQTKLNLGSCISFKSYSEKYSKDLSSIDDRAIDLGIPQINIMGRVVNFGLGAYLSSKNGFLGVSTNSLVNDLQLLEDIVKVPSFKSIDFIGGYQFRMSDDLQLLAQGMGRIANRLQSTFDINSAIEYQRKINFGIGLRIGNPVANALLFNSGFSLSNGYMGIAYEYPLSQLRGAQLGSFELIGYYSFKLKKSKYEGFNPRFF